MGLFPIWFSALLEGCKIPYAKSEKISEAAICKVWGVELGTGDGLERDEMGEGLEMDEQQCGLSQ